MELKIYDKANNLRLTASPNSSSAVTEEIGGECSVSASFTHTTYVPLDVDDYIEIEGVHYKVKSRYRPKPITSTALRGRPTCSTSAERAS